METVDRVNITDAVRLRRIEIARQIIGASTPTKAAGMLLDKELTEMGIPLVPEGVDVATEAQRILADAQGPGASLAST